MTLPAMMLKVIFLMRDGVRRECLTAPGQTLLDVARKNNIDEIEGACDGAMACSTCHVIIDGSWVAKLPLASEDEIDMLDLAPGLTRTSRLGCQIRMTEALNGLTVKLPTATKSLLG